ncbi:Hsp70 family protein [Micromonospora sp. CPCC 206061]|uniref:Hsp70 family protein n=1 Tax=Micromonospora sp. CPCC 206061 TaxID=3122410 RepID=UPI002FF30E23
MAQEDGAYALGVDLGTSNTVAVLRWPDSRTRPLLFDGQPITPSAVYLDDVGRLHAGRDAQRLGQADPARYEPNPKRHVDDAGVLLGGREIPTADLLAAVLSSVGRTAVEAVGFLPPAVLTYPASWGARRRDVLATAVARAGWPPVGTDNGGTRMAPEPVAAARYFADVLRRPVPVGAAIAVFDFGGGTLDIAVVRNEAVDQDGRATFVVVGSGGLAELGGLDLDAALVDHLGRLLAGAHPAAWQALTAPTTAVQWRHRRQFWDDVRGAKEMLSRTTTAPVAVPGVDQAVHLTRDELERLVAPLLRRSVYEAGAVIGNCGLRPDQLAGLFLVGGSSRVPLVARMLHAELGIAPTVLEQPELPVAEGALTELVAPVPAVGVPGATAPTSAVPVSPAEPTVQMSAAHDAGRGPARALRKRPVLWLAAAVLALAGVVTATVVFLTSGGYDKIAFEPVSELYSIPVGKGETPYYAYTGFVGDHAYLAYEREDKRLEIVAVDPPGKKERWRKQTSSLSERWAGITVLPDVVVAYEDRSSNSEFRNMIVFDADSGDELWNRLIRGDDRAIFAKGVMVLVNKGEDRLLGLDLRTGTTRWEHENPKDGYGDGDDAVYQALTVADVSGPSDVRGTPFAQRLDDDQRIVQIGADRSARVIDAVNGDVLKTRPNVADPDDQIVVYNGQMIVASVDESYRLSGYDLDSLGEPNNLYTSPDKERDLNLLAMCGEKRLCLLDTAGSDGTTTEVVAVDLEEGGRLWHKSAPQAELLIHFGDQVAARTITGDYRTLVFADDGTELVNREGAIARVDGGNMIFLESSSDSVGDYSVAGLHTDAKRPIEMGQLNDVRSWSCSWNNRYMVCARQDDFSVSQFAQE